MGVPRKNKRGKSDPRKTDRRDRRGRQEKGPQKYETGERPTDGLREREIVTGGEGGSKGGTEEGAREKVREGKRRRSPRLDIKNISCGNLTTGKGGQGRDADDVARKAQEGCVEKQERKREEAKREGGEGCGRGYSIREFLRLLRACACTPGD